MTINQFRLAQEIGNSHPSIKRALTFNQRTFGSLCRKKYVDFDAYGNVFFLTILGHDALHFYQKIERIYRENNNERFSIYVKTRNTRGKVIKMRRRVA